MSQKTRRACFLMYLKNRQKIKFMQQKVNGLIVFFPISLLLIVTIFGSHCCALAVRGSSPVLFGCTLSCVGWGRLVAIVLCRSGLYLGRSLFENYKHSKWLFRRTSWCPMASPHPRLTVWELKCLKWLFSSVIVVTGKFWQAHGDT